MSGMCWSFCVKNPKSECRNPKQIQISKEAISKRDSPLEKFRNIDDALRNQRDPS